MNKKMFVNRERKLKKWTWNLNRLFVCIAIAGFVTLTPCSVARSADWSMNVGGVTVECNVENVTTDFFGVWVGFFPGFTCGEPNDAATKFDCIRVGISASYKCLPLDSHIHHCGNYWVDMSSVQTTINLPAGTKNAQNKVCGDLFPSLKITVKTDIR